MAGWADGVPPQPACPADLAVVVRVSSPVNSGVDEISGIERVNVLPKGRPKRNTADGSEGLLAFCLGRTQRPPDLLHARVNAGAARQRNEPNLTGPAIRTIS